MIDHLVAGKPSISTAQFKQVLADRGSPTVELSDELYRVCLAHGTDPAVALAFFVHESACGTLGYARKTKNWGNLRRGPGQYAIDRNFAYYASFVVSLNDWCLLLRGPMYEGKGLKTVSQVIPVYAPATENDVVAYVSAVNGLVDQWIPLQSQPKGG